MKKLVCWTIGHDIDPCDDYASECFRCGLTFDFDKPPRSDLGFWLTICAWFPYSRRAAIREWILGCQFCGKRLGRHAKNCIPF